MERHLTLDDMIPVRAPSRANTGNTGRYHRHENQTIWRGTGGAQRSPRTVEHDAATYVMPDGARRLREQLAEDIPSFTTDTRRRRRDHQTVGTSVKRVMDYERFRQGASAQPRFWTRYERKERRHEGVVTIACNFGMTGDQPTEHLEWRGAATLALIDLLEGLGYRCNLFGVITSHGHDGFPGGYNVTVECKGPADRVSEQAMALLCDGGIRRVLWWGHLLSCEERTNTYYGSPYDYAGEITFDVTVPQHIRSYEDARAWVQGAVDALRARGEEA